ncbi:Receptor-type tyrosine-protein phosphatase mu [Lamellibrachia satsuma]|nr:Receptor-type tyrosine-protein phosphatase mu [Lamellibrachia satsuma]
MEGIERKSYSAAVIEGVRKRARVFVGDSIVRKTDRVLNKGDDVVVCLPGAKIEAITERVKNIVGSDLNIDECDSQWAKSIDAGVGRTGTFIALDYLLDQAKAEGTVDVFHCVYNMRMRRVNMVQTQEQYVFVYDALLEAFKSGDTAVSCVDFRKRFMELSRLNPQTGKLRLLEEYELLQAMSPVNTTSSCQDAVAAENISKNRNMQILPLDNVSRPYIQMYIPLSTDYINAVFSDGYKQRDAFIVTQMPLPNTVTDFWAMMIDHKCKSIVMMNEVNPADVTSACYFPDEGASWAFGPFTVKTVSVETINSDVTIRSLTASYNKKPGVIHSVQQFHYHGWPEDSSLPTSLSSLISLLSVVQRWQQRSGNRPIVVHCMDGATRSGLFCAVSYMVEHLKVEQEVDVFQSVKHVRINRPQLIPTFEQYKCLYEMAVEYMDCFETYSNFK